MAKTRREFTSEFKREAVALWETSGRPQMEIAAELDTSKNPAVGAAAVSRCRGVAVSGWGLGLQLMWSVEAAPGHLQPDQASSGVCRMSQVARFMLWTRLASPIVTVARAMPIVLTTSAIGPFWRANTCSTVARTLDLAPLAREMLTGIGLPGGFLRWICERRPLPAR